MAAFFSKRGQSAVEYVALVVIVIGAFIAVSVYLKRGMQGRWKVAVDGLGEQYDPRAADTNIVYETESTTRTDIMTMNTAEGFWTKRADETTSVERRSGYSTMMGAWE